MKNMKLSDYVDNENDVIRIDGSSGEGGGQIIRNSICYSMLLNKCIVIEKIRHNRKQPGLRRQHSTGVHLLGSSFGKEMIIVGNSVSSTELLFLHKRNVEGKCDSLNLMRNVYVADIETAGSCMLLLQASLPCLLFGAVGKTVLKIIGGTNVSFSAPAEEIQYVLKPLLQEHFGCSFEMEVTKRGFFPRGGGEVQIKVNDRIHEPLKAINLVNRGNIVKFRLVVMRGQSVSDSSIEFLKNKVKDGILKFVTQNMKQKTKDIEFELIDEKSSSKGFFSGGILATLVSITDTKCYISGSSAIYNPYDRKTKRVLNMKTIVYDLVSSMEKELKLGGCKSCVDEYIQDQLILYMALAKGKSTIISSEPTTHTKTAIDIAMQLTDAKFELKVIDAKSNLYSISCDGIGFKNETI